MSYGSPPKNSMYAFNSAYSSFDSEPRSRMSIWTDDDAPISPLPTSESISRVMISSPSASRSRIGVIVVVAWVLPSATVTSSLARSKSLPSRALPVEAKVMVTSPKTASLSVTVTAMGVWSSPSSTSATAADMSTKAIASTVMVKASAAVSGSAASLSVAV